MQLGDLEKQVLQYLWSAGEADAKRVHAALGQSRGNALNTIQSTLDRLFKKGLLNREKQGHAFVYEAKVSRDGLIAKLITHVTHDFVEDGEHSLVAAFNSVSESLDDHQLDELESLILEQRKARGG